MTDDDFFAQYKALDRRLENDQKALLEQYKATNQKYPLGFTFSYKNETAKINGCSVQLIEPDYISNFGYVVYIAYTCSCIEDIKNEGVRVLQVEIDRILDR